MKNYNIVFESDRIYFIKLSEKLVNEYLNMVNDKDVQKYISRNRKPYTLTLEQELEWINNKLKKDAVIFSMIEKETNKFIGNIEITHIKNNIGEMGIAITKEQQDKHFGTEAINTLIDYVYNTLKLDGLELNVYSFNPRAINCYEKVGFIKDGKGKTEEEIHMKLKR